MSLLPPDGFQAYKSSNPFVKPLGPMFEKTGDDSIPVRGFWIDERHLNSAGILHGGMAMTFADIICARPLLDMDIGPFVTVQMNTRFTAPARVGEWLTGRGVFSGRDDDLYYTEGTLRVGERLVASIDAVFKVI